MRRIKLKNVQVFSSQSARLKSIYFELTTQLIDIFRAQTLKMKLTQLEILIEFIEFKHHSALLYNV